MRSTRRGRRGAVAIETVVCATAVVLLMFAAIQGSLLAGARGSVAFAAEQAARFASLRGAGSGAPAGARQIENFIRGQVPGLDPARLKVTAEWLPDNRPGSRVRVRAEYSAPLLLSAGVPSVKLASTSAMVISQ